MKINALFTTLALLIISAIPARAALQLNEGDSVIVVGNTFAERVALSGYLDAMIHAANPDKKIEIRSVPNSADEVDEMPRIRAAYALPHKERSKASSPREHSVPTGEFYLKRHGADVVVMCYGMSESFDGLGGAEKFKQDLAKEVDFHINAKYNGETAPKIVLVSPIAHEDLGAPLPTGDAVKQRNAVLKAYTAAMRSVASDKKAIFIDLFTPSAELYKASTEPLTNNGIAPNEAGCFHFTAEMAKQLGWWDGKAAADTGKADDFRKIAYDKHYHWRHRYRATNTEYVWGRRHRPFGNVNFPPELVHLDKMAVAREAALHAMDKPSLGELFAKAPTGKAVWETTPTTYNFPGDKYDGVPIPVKDIKKDKKAGDPSKIDLPQVYLDTFEVADGYQVNLFASEQEFPELQNPLAMTFDYKGRLWVLCAPTYPHPYPGEVTDCKVIILDDTDGDGKADKRTIFAQHMNIPTCFVIDANGVAYIGQAPDLWKFTDTDGDDVADRKEMVYSGFGMCDSHHSISAAVWDPNGGILMLEGVFTRTNVETPYGTQRTKDAAIWRFDPVTQKLIAIGHTSHPNPWGQTFDEFGQSILMDTSGQAHYNFSSLISPYIGLEKPKKGPAVMQRGRPNSGADFVYSSHFPDDVQGTYVHSQCIGFLGTHWTRLVADGANNSGFVGEPMPAPVLSSKNGNYRPVCSEFGPDGALYIADWVNPLIGHMQFNLRDPRRDHTHGRIYRVSHKERPLVEKIDLTTLDMNGLLETFKLPEQNTRDRARRLLQNMDSDTVAQAASDWLFKQNPREDWYERASLEVLWVQQGVKNLDMKIVDEVMRAREPLAQAGAIRALRIGLQFGDLSSADCKSFISQAIGNRDMRVRLEAVMACAYLDDPSAVDIANRVTEQPMDGVIRNAHQQTIKYLKQVKGIVSMKGLPRIYAMETQELIEESKKKTDDESSLIKRVLVVRPDIDETTRREALTDLAGNENARAKLLMQLANNTLFDPNKTAEAITPLLLEFSSEAVFAISGDLDKLIAGNNDSLKSTAVALKVRGGAPLGELAKKYPAAVIQAIATLPPDQAPEGLDQQLLSLAEDGTLNPGLAFGQAARLTSDMDGLFTQIASHVENVKDLDYDNWGPGHRLAMASLGVMHSIPREDWPTGYSEFMLARADQETLELGKELYYEEEKGCVKCHGEHGEGTEGFPPLAGSANLLGDPLRAATIVKHGLKGELAHTVNPSDNKPYNAQMEPLNYFNNAEIAAVVTYARQHFGNFASPVTAKQVAATRPSEDGLMWDISALLTQYPFERDRITGPMPPPSIDLQKWAPPASGLPVMLIVVGFSMLLILAGTYAGKFLDKPGSVAEIANDHMQTPAH